MYAGIIDKISFHRRRRCSLPIRSSRFLSSDVLPPYPRRSARMSAGRELDHDLRCSRVMRGRGFCCAFNDLRVLVVVGVYSRYVFTPRISISTRISVYFPSVKVQIVLLTWSHWTVDTPTSLFYFAQLLRYFKQCISSLGSCISSILTTRKSMIYTAWPSVYWHRTCITQQAIHGRSTVKLPSRLPIRQPN